MAQLKDLLVEGKSRFIDKIYASDQFISTVAQGTSPFVISSSTLVSNLNADLVDGQHFNYSNTSNSPTYLWGTSSNGTNYLVSRANMHAGIADKITTVTRSTDAWHYPTFVDSDNSTATEESLYTAGGLRFNPSTRAIAIGTTSTASGSGAIAAGTYATADGTNAVAIGGYVTAIGSGAFARGTFVSAAHGNGISTAFGSNWAWNVNLTGDANVTSYTCTPAADSGMAELLAKFWSTHSGSIKNAFILGGRIYDAALADVTITNMAYSNGTLTFTFSRTLSATAISNKTYYIICCIAGGEGSFVNTGFVGQGGKWSLAGGRFSMALGDYGAISYGHLNIAGGGSSAAFGNHTLTYNNGEFACGSFNKSTSGSTKFSVGIGSADNARKNAFEIVSNGNAFLNGVFTINAPAYSANATWTYPGGSYASVASPNIRLIGDPTYGLSTIEFISQKGETSINKPSDCAFIQFQPYGTTTQSAVGSQPTLASSGELNRLVIGVNNDATDTLVLQTPSTTGLKHAVGTGLYTIWDSGNDGSGSGLDADLLDGKHASDFSLAHSHPYLPLAGGTMTGTIYSGSGLVQIWRGSATSGSAGYNTYLAYSGGNIYLATYGSTNTGKTIYLETYDTDLYHRKNLTNYKIWDEGNDGSGSGLDADTVDGIHANSFKTRLTNEKALGQPGWYRILDCTTYSMTFFITFYGGYNYQPPTPATFSVNHSYNTTSITQIGNCPYIGWITKIRAVHYDTYKFYIDIYFNNTSYASNNNAKNNVNFEITPLDVASRSYITLVDYTLITDTVTSNAECATQTTIVPDNAQGANYLNKYNTAVANKLQYACGQFTIGTAAGNAIEGSSASFNLWSYPAGGAYVSSSVANIQTIRLSWDGTHYWHDILASPNYEDLWHRSVINASGKAWRKILDSSNYVSYLGYIGTTPVQASSVAQAVTGITALTFNGATSAGTNYITGTAGRIYFGGNFHLDSLGSNATYINHYTANNVYLVTGGGKVGIGTASPTEKLHVAGNTYISGTLETPGPVRITSTSGEKNILIGNQDSAGANKPAIIKSANAALYFGTGTSWSGTGGTMTTTLFLSGDNKVGIGTTSPENKLDVNGVASIYPRGADNTAFKGNLIIKQQNSTEDTGQDYTGSKPSFGIQFNRFWTSNGNPSGETAGAGIFATVSSSWRGGLVFRTKNNQTQGGTHDTNALRLRPDGNAVLAGGIGSSGTKGNVTGAYIDHPAGGCYATNTSSVTGYLKITLPQKGKNTMMSFDVTIYTYDGANQSYTTYHISGYEYSTNGWYEPVTKVYSEGIGPYTNLAVRLGNDGTYACVTIGESNTVWTYPQVTIHNIMTGYSNAAVDTWIGGWSVDFTTTALTTVVATRSSVNTQNINVSGSAGSVAWGNITGKPINFKAYSGSLSSGGWKTLQGKDSAPSIAISYNNSAANWNSGTYSASMVWGCSDTRGLIDCAYNTPKVTFGGCSYGGATDDNPTWYFKIKGTSGTEYDFDSRWSLSTHNHDSIYHPLNGKITRSGGSYSWYQFQQYKDASKNSPSYYSADCAIININSYSGWQPWIRGVASDLASWCIGQYTDALHVARIAVSNTTNTTTNRWDFQSNGNFKSAVGFVYGNSTYATSAYLLRADGSVTAISSFATSSHNHDSSYVKKAGDTMTGQLYINYDQDVGLNQNGSLVIGNKAGENIAIDANEIMARNNSAASTLYLNNEGGNIVSAGSGNFGIGTSSPSYKLHVTGTVYSTGAPGFYNSVAAGNWSYLRLHNGSNFWDIATKSNTNSGALDFRPGGVDNIGPLFQTNGMAIFSNCGNTSTGTYSEAAVQIREYHRGGSQSDTWGNAPRFAWHWSGRVAAQIGLASNGWLYEAPLTATNYYRIVVEGSTGVTWGINISGNAATATTATNADTLDGEHAYQLRAWPKNNSNIIYSSLPYLENNISAFGAVVTTSMENAPEGLCYGPISSYKSYTSDFVAVEPGETVYGEIWAYRASDATGTAGTLYYGIQRFDRNKKPISANAGLNAPNNGYFVCSGVTVPADGTWHKYSATHTIPTSHTAYSGSDGKGVYYVKVYVLVNYSAGTIPTYIGRFLLARKAQIAATADTATNADTVDNEHASAFAHRQTWNNMIHSGNEYTWVAPGYTGGVWINYRTSSGATDGSINEYIFGTGKGTQLAKISLNTFHGNITGSAAAADKLNFERVSDIHATTGWRVFTTTNSSPSNGPVANKWMQGITFLPNNDTNGYRNILAFVDCGANNELWIQTQGAGTWGTWRKILNSSNFSSYAATVDHNHDGRYLRNYHKNTDITSTEVVNTTDFLYNVGETGSASTTMTKPSGIDNAWGILHMHLHTGNYAMQLGFGGTKSQLYFRNAYNTATFGSWITVVDSNNIGTYAVPKLPWTTSGNGASVNNLICGTTFYYTNHGAPTNGTVASFSGTSDSYQLQIQGQYNGKAFYYRSKNGDNGTWNDWTRVIDTANYSSYLGYIGTTAVKATSGAGQDMTGIGTIYIQGTQGSYREGIRIKPYSSWSTIVLGGTDLTADSGTSTKSWGLFNNDGNFYLTKNGSSSSSTAMLSNVSNNWNFAKGNVGIGVASPSSPLDVSGGYIKVTYNGNTLSIGSGNTSWTHFSNSSSRPFYFSHSASFNGAVLPYTDNSSTLGDSTHRWTTIYSMQATLKAAQGTAPLTVDSSTLVSNLNADFLDGLHASAFARNATLGTTVAMADAGGTITVEANKIIPVTTTNTTTVTFSFAWTGANNCDIAHILITGSGSSKMINIGDMSTGTTKKNVQAILVTSGGFGEISILYANSTYYIRAVGS